MTRDKLLAYVQSLPGTLQEIFLNADMEVKYSYDTLSDEFQIAAAIVKVFEEYAARKLQ